MILSLDISLTSTGWAVTEVVDGKVNVIDYGHIPTKRVKGQTNEGRRLDFIKNTLASVIREYNLPPIVVREAGIGRFNKETQAIFKAHGIIEWLLQNWEFIEYPPNTIKKTVTGNGHADKELVAKAVLPYLTQDITFIKNDESDAVAIAINHYITTGLIEPITYIPKVA